MHCQPNVLWFSCAADTPPLASSAWPRLLQPLVGGSRSSTVIPVARTAPDYHPVEGEAPI